jgi:hypothetical protein
MTNKTRVCDSNTHQCNGGLVYFYHVLILKVYKIVDFSVIQDRTNSWWSTYADLHIRCLDDHANFIFVANRMLVASFSMIWVRIHQNVHKMYCSTEWWSCLHMRKDHSIYSWVLELIKGIFQSQVLLVIYFIVWCDWQIMLMWQAFQFGSGSIKMYCSTEWWSCLW